MTQNKSGADAVAEGLVDAGIEVVFGIPGVYNVSLFDAVRRRPELRVVAVRHEQGAAFMADGYARASGKPAACILLPGCGVLNAMTALSEAYADSSPVLLCATQVDREHIDGGSRASPRAHRPARRRWLGNEEQRAGRLCRCHPRGDSSRTADDDHRTSATSANRDSLGRAERTL